MSFPEDFCPFTRAAWPLEYSIAGVASNFDTAPSSHAVSPFQQQVAASGLLNLGKSYRTIYDPCRESLRIEATQEYERHQPSTTHEPFTRAKPTEGYGAPASESRPILESKLGGPVINSMLLDEPLSGNSQNPTHLISPQPFRSSMPSLQRGANDYLHAGHNRYLLNEASAGPRSEYFRLDYGVRQHEENPPPRVPPPQLDVSDESAPPPCKRMRYEPPLSLPYPRAIMQVVELAQHSLRLHRFQPRTPCPENLENPEILGAGTRQYDLPPLHQVQRFSDYTHGANSYLDRPAESRRETIETIPNTILPAQPGHALITPYSNSMYRPPSVNSYQPTTIPGIPMMSSDLYRESLPNPFRSVARACPPPVQYSSPKSPSSTHLNEYVPVNRSCEDDSSGTRQHNLSQFLHPCTSMDLTKVISHDVNLASEHDRSSRERAQLKRKFQEDDEGVGFVKGSLVSDLESDSDSQFEDDYSGSEGDYDGDVGSDSDDEAAGCGAPAGGSHEDSDDDSKNDNIDSNASTATLQREIPENHPNFDDDDRWRDGDSQM
ncbi:hypothetical protein FKW77_006649 [Venturia effusa]|uniref:Uncharacterized protein n=1 Tax=Venturia effusa TaxID=50376 RepID=A0A517LQC1_9PEZI|nr:hypothetical protein FKW77_006649 [Venturia effusa]